MKQIKQPISIIVVNRILIVLVVLLALLAGYFHAKTSNQVRITKRLFTKYQAAQERISELEDLILINSPTASTNSDKSK